MTREAKLEAALADLCDRAEGAGVTSYSGGWEALYASVARARAALAAPASPGPEPRAALAAPASPGPEPRMEEIEGLVNIYGVEERDWVRRGSYRDDTARPNDARSALLSAIRRALEAKSSREPWNFRAADALAVEVEKLIERKVIDSRSPAADALLDYRDGKIQGPHLGSASPGERRACPVHGEPLHQVWRCDKCPGMGVSSGTPAAPPAPSWPAKVQGEGPCLCEHAENPRRAHKPDCPARRPAPAPVVAPRLTSDDLLTGPQDLDALADVLMAAPRVESLDHLLDEPREAAPEACPECGHPMRHHLNGVGECLEAEDDEGNGWCGCTGRAPAAKKEGP